MPVYHIKWEDTVAAESPIDAVFKAILQMQHTDNDSCTWEVDNVYHNFHDELRKLLQARNFTLGNQIVFRKDVLINAKPGSIIFQGESIDRAGGLNFSNTNKMLRWVLKRMEHPDMSWIVYAEEATKPWHYIETNGHTVSSWDSLMNIIYIPDDEQEFLRRLYYEHLY